MGGRKKDLGERGLERRGAVRRRHGAVRDRPKGEGAVGDLRSRFAFPSQELVTPVLSFLNASDSDDRHGSTFFKATVYAPALQNTLHTYPLERASRLVSTSLSQQQQKTRKNSTCAGFENRVAATRVARLRAQEGRRRARRVPRERSLAHHAREEVLA